MNILLRHKRPEHYITALTHTSQYCITALTKIAGDYYGNEWK